MEQVEFFLAEIEGNNPLLEGGAKGENACQPDHNREWDDPCADSSLSPLRFIIGQLSSGGARSVARQKTRALAGALCRGEISCCGKPGEKRVRGKGAKLGTPLLASPHRRWTLADIPMVGMDFVLDRRYERGPGLRDSFDHYSVHSGEARRNGFFHLQIAGSAGYCGSVSGASICASTVAQNF